MSKGDIVCLQFKTGENRTRERAVVRWVKGETFGLELIEGSLDGTRFVLTRAQLDANQEIDTGGDEWKPK